MPPAYPAELLERWTRDAAFRREILNHPERYRLHGRAAEWIRDRVTQRGGVEALAANELDVLPM